MRRMICPVGLACLFSLAAYARSDWTIASFQRRLDDLKHTNNACIRLGKAVAQRFVDFAKTGGTNGPMSLAWTKMQIDGFAEVAQVLDETEKLAQRNAPVLDWTPPKLGTVKLKNGTFYNRGRPYYFYGYGHFGSVIEDLPNFPALGASLIQDGRAGPSSMNADGTLGEGALAVLQGLDRAAQFGMRDDFLLSPHYYPAWAWAPDLPSGGIGFNFNIFHPKAKAVIGQWAAVMAERMKDKPALHSVCLANEPAYNASGRDKYTRPLFIDYLKEKHHSLDRMNALYGAAYTNFDQAVVPPCAMPAEMGAQRAYYDWTCFNNKMFADWHAWLGSVLKAHGVKAPTHSKICVFQTLDRDKVGWGIDPELICHATDLAGCDAYAPYGWHSGSYVYDFLGHELFYDLLHSFRGQPVFNSENHLSTDGSGPCARSDEPHPLGLVAGRPASPRLDHHLGLGDVHRPEPGREHLLSSRQHLRRGPRHARSQPPGPGSHRHQQRPAARRPALLAAVHFLGGEIQRNAFLHLHRAQFHGRAHNLCQRAATGRGHGGQS